MVIETDEQDDELHLNLDDPFVDAKSPNLLYELQWMENAIVLQNSACRAPIHSFLGEGFIWSEDP